MRITIELDDRDWGRIAGAMESKLGRERKLFSDLSFQESRMAQSRVIANLARIKTELWRQRRQSRVSAKTLREASRAMKADMYGENGNG